MATSKSYLIKIGADASAVTKAIQGINGQTSSLKRLAGTLDSAFKINGDTSVLKAKLTALNGAVKSSEQSANSLKAQFAKMSSGANFNPASASAQKLQMRIAQADAETLKLKAQADQTGSALDKMSNADISKLGDEAKSAGGGFTVLKGALAGIVANTVTSALSAIGSSITELAGTMNANSKAWQTFTGNMKMMGQSTSSINATKTALQDFATQTIFSASDMAGTYSQLNAVGTKNTLSLVKGFGGLASAAEDPQQAMKTLSQQATQMAAKPMVQWGDFKLMLEQTPAGVSAIAKTMGMTTGQLVKQIQGGTVKTQELFDAISKTGTNKAFTKMATQFKTVDQAVDGLKENLANKLQPTFDAVSQVGIQAISALTDGLSGFKMPSFDVSGLAIIGNQLKAMFAGLDFSGLTNLGNAILPALQSAFTAFLSYVTPALQPLLNAFKNLWNAIQPIITVIASALMPVFQVLGSYIGGFVSGAMSGITTAFNILAGVIKFLTPVVQFIGKVIQAVGPILSVVAGFVGKLMGSFTAFNGVMGVVGKLAGSIFKGVASAGKSLWSSLSGFFKSISGAFKTVGTNIGSIASSIGSKFKGVASAGHSVWSSLSGIFKSISGAFRTVGTNISSIASSIRSKFSGLGSSASTAVSKILGAFKGIGGKIGDYFKGVYGSIKNSIGSVTSIGTNIVSGIAKGIRGAWGTVTSAISALTSMIPKKIRKFLGIKSPSRVMRDQVGVYITQGVAVGMKKGFKYVRQASAQLSKNVTNTMGGLKNKFNSGKLSATQYLKALKQMKKVASSKTGYNSNIANRIDSRIIAQNNRMKATTKASKKQLATIKNNLKTTQNGLQSSVKSAISTYNKTVKEALRSAQDTVFTAYSMFDQVANNKLSGKGLTNNLISQVNALSRYQGAMAKLKKNGASTSLLNTLRSMGVGNVDEVSALANMTKKDLATYQSYYNKKVSLSNAVAKSDPEYLSAVNSAKTTFDKSLRSSLSTFDNKVRGYGVQAKNNGLYIGKNLQSGLVSALSISKSSPLANALKSLSKSIKNTMKKNLGIKSPSRVMRDEVGKYIPQGIAVGMTGQSAYINQKAGVLRDQLTNSLSNFQTPAIALGGGSLNSSAGLVGSSSNSTSVVINVSGGDPNAVVPLIRRELRRNGIS